MKPIKAWAVLNAEDIGGLAASYFLPFHGGASLTVHLPIFKLRTDAVAHQRLSKGHRVKRVTITF